MPALHLQLLFHVCSKCVTNNLRVEYMLTGKSAVFPPQDVVNLSTQSLSALRFFNISNMHAGPCWSFPGHRRLSYDSRI